MTVKVRSSEGEEQSNQTGPDLNSPSSITAGDTLAIVWCMNDDVDVASDLTPPAGFGLVGELADAAVGDRGMRYAVWTKIATATDATNQGAANYYSFLGMGGVTDFLYGIFSLYDDASGVVRLKAGSLADNHQDDLAGSTTAIAPTQTIGNNGSIALCCWAARQGTDYFNVGTGPAAYAPTGGSNSAVYHDTSGWTSSSQSALEWVTGTAEFDIADSPIGTQTLTHLNITGSPSPVDCYSVSMIFEAVSATALEVFVGQTALPTASTGTTDLTSADSTIVPVGALYNASRATVADTLAGDFVLNIGMSDGTTDRAMSTTANDGAAADDATKGYYNGAIAQTTPGAQVEDGLVTHNSFIAGGQRVNNVNGFASAYLNNNMFFAGCNFTTKEVTLNATVDTVVNVDPGHAWDVVIVTQCQETTIGDEDADNNGSFGFMTKADDAQACIVTGTNNGDASPGGPSLQISTTYAGMVVNPGTGALVFGIDVEEGSGTSCDIYPRIAGGQSVLVALTFIGFTDSSAAKIVTWDTPTAAGNNSITGAGGEPLALIHLISRAAAYDTAEADAEAGTLGISLITPDSQFSTNSMNEFATGGVSSCKNIATAQSIRTLRHDGNSGLLNSYGSLYVSMDSDGWTEDWEEVEDSAAGKCVTLAFTGATAAASSIGGGLNRGVARGVMRGVG